MSAIQLPADRDWRERDVLSVQDAARILGISRNTAYESARDGDLPVIKLGKRRVVPVPALRRLLGEAV